VNDGGLWFFFFRENKSYRTISETEGRAVIIRSHRNGLPSALLFRGRFKGTGWRCGMKVRSF